MLALRTVFPVVKMPALRIAIPHSAERPKIDPNFEEVTEDAEESTKESLRRKWAQLEAMVGTDKRIALVAEDLVKHWEARYAAMESARTDAVEQVVG